MFSRRPAKIDGPYWYQFLPVSVVIHVAVFGLYCFCVPQTAAWQVFAVQSQEERQIIPFREAVIEWTEVTESVEITEAVSPDEDPFDEGPVEIVQPEIVFHEPAKDEIDEDDKNIQINQGVAQGIVTNFDNSSSMSADSHSEKTQPSDTAVHQQITESGAGSAGERTASGIQAGESSVSGQSSASLNDSNRTSTQVDEQAVWKSYAKQLNEHFKKHHHYPEMARRRRMTGTVWLLVEVRRDGSLISVEIAESSGFPMLDDAAISSVKDSVPVPPFPENITAETKKLRIPYVFKLK
ncbi:MAG: energy transducer TonB [Proteobacteria bacterium]|nr:energy transducer TonB [Pseudomonadota bacterium]